MKILVVDDEADIVDELCSFLTRRGHQVIGAGGVDQAFAALDDGNGFDVVVTDMRMPPRSGVEVVSACSRLATPPAVLLMTGQATSSDVNEALSAGAHSVIWKPVSLRGVMEALAAVAQPASIPATT